MAMMRVKKNDTVLILSGKDKGKRGLVLEVLPQEDKVKVQGIAIVTRHVKARRQGEVGGIKKEESYIRLSKVMPIDPASNLPCRVGCKVTDDGKKVRVSKRSGEAF